MTQSAQLDGHTLRSLRAHPERDLWLSLNAPVVPIERLLDRPDAQWLSTGREGDGQATLHCVGLGVGRRFVASGERRFQDLQADAGQHLERLRVVSPVGSAWSVAPRVFGGFAFAGGDIDESWQAFGDAQFVLPRALYATDGYRGSLGIYVPKAQHQDLDSVLQESLRLRLWLDAEAEAGPLLVDETEPPHLEARQMSSETWQELVLGALAEIRQGSLDKVVLARPSELEFERPLSVPHTLAALGKNHPSASRFAFRAGESWFVGATPELLVSKLGLEVVSEALAGTFRVSQADFTEELLRSPKEHHEHQPVLRAVLDTLGPHCSHLEHAPRPQLRRLRRMLHLHTPIVGSLARPLHVLQLVSDLHPTPAVGGVPSERALSWLAEHEGLGRGWYAGPVGWFDGNGDGEFCVALRSGLIQGRRARLFAGAGIVEGSEPDGEYDETRLKFTALASALRTR